MIFRLVRFSYEVYIWACDPFAMMRSGSAKYYLDIDIDEGLLK